MNLLEIRRRSQGADMYAKGRDGGVVGRYGGVCQCLARAGRSMAMAGGYGNEARINPRRMGEMNPRRRGEGS